MHIICAHIRIFATPTAWNNLLHSLAVRWVSRALSTSGAESVVHTSSLEAMPTRVEDDVRHSMWRNVKECAHEIKHSTAQPISLMSSTQSSAHEIVSSHFSAQAHGRLASATALWPTPPQPLQAWLVQAACESRTVWNEDTIQLTQSSKELRRTSCSRT